MQKLTVSFAGITHIYIYIYIYIFYYRLTNMDKNPYGGAESSEDIKSKVIGLALTGPDGKPLDLKGQQMTIFVDRAVTKEENITAPIFNFRLPATYHQFNFTAPYCSMVIELRAHDPLLKVNAAIEFERKPSMSKKI